MQHKNFNSIFRFIFLLISSFWAVSMQAQPVAKEFSTAGFFLLPGTGRTVDDMNPAWRFTKNKKGDLRETAFKTDYNDAAWAVVSLPNGLEYLPEEASGSINYRGEAWYRKHFFLDKKYEGKRLVVYFEAIMGKSKIWINGQLAAEHFGGFLPIPVDITAFAKPGAENLLAVWADNSDDPAYPPGKPQAMLDFAYFGGIYRDCWLIATNKVFITDANETDIVAGGGLKINYPMVSDKQAGIDLNLHLQNDLATDAKGEIQYELMDEQGKKVAASRMKYQLNKGQQKNFKQQLPVLNPALWSPDHPNLYHLNIRVTGAKGQVLDGYTKRIGIRSIQFSPSQGLVLNGKAFPRKLIGANRHQDYAVVGNALSNSLHWRDAYKLKQAGMDIIRNAHYPQDPAFMDACEELGLFIIENTPGWQFWNKAPIFQERVFQDIRNMVRRDRNSPSVMMWEPILNETDYPEDFAENVNKIVKQEMSGSEAYTAADLSANGSQHFDILFSYPLPPKDAASALNGDPTKIYFTREWGDNVDDWNSHNSPSRASRSWGEVPMLLQMNHYAKPYYNYISYDLLYRSSTNHIGGTLWHSFDHQRGYHPDPFYGGIMDAFRRPKYAYQMFKAQSQQVKPMVFIANEMTPFSPRDVSVVSNCDEVRLYTQSGDSIRVYQRPQTTDMGGLPSPVIVFEKAWEFMKDKDFSRKKQAASSYLKAEGLINGKVVATDIRYPARRASKLKIIPDLENISPVANGGDLLTVVAQVVDDKGNVKRLNNNFIKFTIEGEANLVGDETIFANPKQVSWGEVPILIQTTTRAGKVRITATPAFEGDQTASPAVLEFETVKPAIPLLYDAQENEQSGQTNAMANSVGTENNPEQKAAKHNLKEVEAQQEKFEGDKKKKKN